MMLAPLRTPLLTWMWHLLWPSAEFLLDIKSDLWAQTSVPGTELYGKIRTQWLRNDGIWLFIKNWHGIISWCGIQLFLHSQPCPLNSIPRMLQNFICYLLNHHRLIYVMNVATFSLLLNTTGLMLCSSFSSNSRLLKSVVPDVHSRFLKNFISIHHTETYRSFHSWFP